MQRMFRLAALSRSVEVPGERGRHNGIATELPTPFLHEVIQFGIRPTSHCSMTCLTSWANNDERIHEGIIDGPLEIVLFPQALRTRLAELPFVSVKMQIALPRLIASGTQRGDGL